MEYKVVAKVRLYELEEEVNKLIKDGWKPQGGIAVTSAYAQAMVKE